MAIQPHTEQASCRVITCTRQLVVEIYTVREPLVKITSCSNHAGEWIWEMRRKYPGHTGIRTRRING